MGNLRRTVIIFLNGLITKPRGLEAVVELRTKISETYGIL